jgi:hypothetical protein
VKILVLSVGLNVRGFLIPVIFIFKTAVLGYAKVVRVTVTVFEAIVHVTC